MSNGYSYRKNSLYPYITMIHYEANEPKQPLLILKYEVGQTEIPGDQDTVNMLREAADQLEAALKAKEGAREAA